MALRRRCSAEFTCQLLSNCGLLSLTGQQQLHNSIWQQLCSVWHHRKVWFMSCSRQQQVMQFREETFPRLHLLIGLQARNTASLPEH